MKKFTSKVKSALVAFAIVGCLGFGAAQAVQSNAAGSRCTDPDTGCPCKPGCRYGGGRVGCCLIP